MGMSVADNFLTRLIFIFLFFLVMTMYANEFQTKEKQKLTGKKKVTATCPKFISTPKRYQSSNNNSYVPGTANFNSTCI